MSASAFTTASTRKSHNTRSPPTRNALRSRPATPSPKTSTTTAITPTTKGKTAKTIKSPTSPIVSPDTECISLSRKILRSFGGNTPKRMRTASPMHEAKTPAANKASTTPRPHHRSSWKKTTGNKSHAACTSFLGASLRNPETEKPATNNSPPPSSFQPTPIKNFSSQKQPIRNQETKTRNQKKQHEPFEKAAAFNTLWKKHHKRQQRVSTV
ncbi:hypothetical protein D6783_00315 [Candidatus Woesearchaeota archaeon]|nr:MAG: hypothetical protein D6783_00315 [Candidatus Woesearchaeota archaeon]